jgi:catechol 2,3-dioxygenase-like lactoylglutathione lyase family enzyme
MLRLDHVVLPIWDVEKSIAFYRDLLGLKLVDAYDGDDWGGYPWLMLQFGLPDKREIVLVHFSGLKKPPPDKSPKDGRHIAFAETTSLEPWRKKLRQARVEFWEEEHGGQQSLYFQDPNAITLEITSPPTSPELVHNERAVIRALKWLKDRGE